MQTVKQTNEETKETIETLEGVAYELRPCNHRRWKLRVGGRARLFVAEWTCYVPQGEFFFVSGRNRYRLKLDGGVSQTLVFRPLQNYRNAERQREAWFRPVRIVAIEEIKIPPPPGTEMLHSHPLSAEQVGLVERLVPADCRFRAELIRQAKASRIQMFLPGRLVLFDCPRELAIPELRLAFTRAGTNRDGEPITLTLKVIAGRIARFVCAGPDGNPVGRSDFGMLPTPDSLGEAARPSSGA